MADPRDILRSAAQSFTAGEVDFAALERAVTMQLMDNAGFDDPLLPEAAAPTPARPAAPRQRQKQVAPTQDPMREYAAKFAQTVIGMPIHDALIKSVPKKKGAAASAPSGAWTEAPAAPPLGQAELQRLSRIARETSTRAIAGITSQTVPSATDKTNTTLLATPLAEGLAYRERVKAAARKAAARKATRGDESFFEADTGPERDFETRAREYNYNAAVLRSRAQEASAEPESSGDSPLSQREVLLNEARRFELAAESPTREFISAVSQGIETGLTGGIYDAVNPIESELDSRTIAQGTTSGVVGNAVGYLMPFAAEARLGFSALRQSAKFASLPAAQQSMALVTALRAPQAVASVASGNVDPASAFARLAPEVLGAGLIPGTVQASANLAQNFERPIVQSIVGNTANVAGQSAIGLGQAYAQTFGEGLGAEEIFTNIAQQIGLGGFDVQPILRARRNAQSGGGSSRPVVQEGERVNTILEDIPVAEATPQESPEPRVDESPQVRESVDPTGPVREPEPVAEPGGVDLTPPAETPIAIKQSSPTGKLSVTADQLTTHTTKAGHRRKGVFVENFDEAKGYDAKAFLVPGKGYFVDAKHTEPQRLVLVNDKLTEHKTKSGAKRRGVFVDTREEALRYDPKTFLVKDQGWFVDEQHVQRQIETTQQFFTHTTRTGAEHEGAIIPQTEFGTTPERALKSARAVDPGSFPLKGGWFIHKEFLTRPEGFVEGANVSRPRLPLPSGAVVRFDPAPVETPVATTTTPDDPFPIGNHPLYGEHADLQQAAAKTLRIPERKKLKVFDSDGWNEFKGLFRKGTSGISEKQYPVEFNDMRKIQRGMQIDMVDVEQGMRDVFRNLSPEEHSMLVDGLKFEGILDELQADRVTAIADDIYNRFKKTREFDAFATKDELDTWGIKTPESDEMGRAAAQELAHRVYERDGVSPERFIQEDEEGIANGFFPGAKLDNQRLNEIMSRWNRHLDTNPNLKAARETYKKNWTDTVNEYAEAYAKVEGAPPAFTREAYIHHMVLDLMDQQFNRFAKPGKQLAKRAKGLHEARVANDYAVSGDIITAQMIAMSKLKADTRVYKFLGDAYENISKPLVAEAKAKAAEATEALRQESPEADPVDWRGFIPDGYQVYSPAKFSSLSTDPALLADPVATDFHNQLAKNFKERTGLNIFELRGKYKSLGDELILPDEFVEGFRRVEAEQFRKRGRVEAATGAFKKWVLMNPWGAPKYNIRNMLGDLNKLPFNPRATLHLGRAASEITTYLRTGEIPSPDFKAYAGEGGVEGVFNVQDDIIRDPSNGRIEFRMGDKATQYASAMERIAKTSADIQGGTKPDDPIVKQAFDTYIEAVNKFSNGREMLLRYANFLEYADQIRNNGAPTNYGSSRKDAVDALPTPEAKAYKLSNELMGAYDQVSQAGTFLARNVFPFFRYRESNMRSYLGALRNAIDDATNMGFVTKAGQDALGRAGRAALPIAYNVGKTYLKMQALQAAAEVLFNLPQSESERKLPKNIRRDSHIVLPFGGENMTAYFNRISTAEDFLESLGLQSLGGDAFYFGKQILSGDMTAEQAFEEWGRGLPFVDDKWSTDLINTWLQGANPYGVTVLEAITGEHTFPNVFERRPYYDKAEIFLSRLGTPAVRAYRTLFPGTEPQRKLTPGELAKEFVFYNIENDYAELQDMKSEVMEYRRGSEKNFSPKYPDKLPYYLRNSLKYKDPESFLYFLEQYIQEKTNTDFDIKRDRLVFPMATDEQGNPLPDVNPDGSKNVKKLDEIMEGIQSTLKSYSPFAGASSEVQQAFLAQASEGVKRKMDHVFKTIESYKHGDNAVSVAIESIFNEGDARTKTIQRLIKEGFAPIKRPKGLPLGGDSTAAPPPALDTIPLPWKAKGTTR